jgi:hypothetical protein
MNGGTLAIWHLFYQGFMLREKYPVPYFLLTLKLAQGGKH